MPLTLDLGVGRQVVQTARGTCAPGAKLFNLLLLVAAA